MEQYKHYGKRKILIVEDSLINQTILVNILEEKYSVMTASNGFEALEIVKNEGIDLSLILVDIKMPIMDGYQFLEEFQKFAVSKKIPVIVQTQNDKDEDEVKALSLGANDFVTKPYNPKVILHRVENLISFYDNTAYIEALQQDPLTKLYRSEFFHQAARKYINMFPTEKFKIVTTNISNFIVINDVFGHDMGNKILIENAKLFAEHFSPYPIGRTGSDNFSALIPQDFVIDEAFVTAFNEELNNRPTSSIDVNIKMGVYIITDNSVSVPHMCDRAMVSIQDIKYKFDKNLSIYNDEIRQKLLDEQIIINSMEEALEKSEFEVYYQPKLNLEDDTFCGAEALVRWISPDKGFMNPGLFIPLFERTGFIIKLDYYVFETVCKDIKDWIDSGKQVLPISINLSRIDFYSNSLVKDLLQIISKYSVPMNLVHLEITESAYTTNQSQILKVAKSLKENGFIIEMDDFGTGYSSLNMLSSLPIDYLKLDMKFVQEGLESQQSRTIIQFIITLAKWLRLVVIAEGIETKEQELMLKEMGCDYGQGYLYSKPIKKAEFEKLVYTTKEVQIVKSNKKIKQPEFLYYDNYSKNIPSMMIISSDEQDKATFSSILENQFNIMFESDANRGLAMLKKYYNKIKIILLNLTQHEYTNTLLIGEIKKVKTLVNIPIVIATTSDRVPEVDAILIGADDFIIKPFVSIVARNRIRNVINSKYIENKFRQKFSYSLTYLDAQTGYLNSIGLSQFFSTMKQEKDEKIRGFVLLTMQDLAYNINTNKPNYLITLLKDVFKVINLTISHDNLLFRLETNQICIILENVDTEEELENTVQELQEELERSDIFSIKFVCGSTLFTYKDDYADVFNRIYKRG